jgi:phospholipid transport system substrate-binding protein
LSAILTSFLVWNIPRLKAQQRVKSWYLLAAPLRIRQKPGEPVAINWRVTTPVDGATRVMDVEIENISMLVTQKNENVAIIRKNQGSFSALIDAMRTKISE